VDYAQKPPPRANECNQDFSTIGSKFVQNNRVVMQRIVPAGATIAELKKKVADCERRAQQAAEPEATKLEEEALLYREWIAALRSAKWHS
jgi:hypothetical protein